VNSTHVYVKISKVYTTGVGTLNLQEIDLYNNGQLIDGSKLTFTQCSVNLQYYSYFNAENCNNDQLGSNWMSLCHTYEDTDSPWILVDAGSETFDEIVVTNRQDCCQDSINGATISVYYGSEELLWSAEFNDLGTSLYSYDFVIETEPTTTPPAMQPSTFTPTSSSTFSYTGSAQTYTVPDDIQYLLVEAYGAEGGSNACYSGGKGGYIKTIISVAPGDTLYVLIGGTSSTNFGGGYPNGGGYGWACSNFNGCNGGASVCQQPGGGSSEIRMIADDTSTRLVVAGAGGGAGFYGKGGEGGGSGGTGVGERGDVCGGCVASGYGGNVGFWNSGGGGGYYGGGSSNYDAGGGGSSNSSSDIILENTMGVNTGTGYVIITPVDSLPTTEPTLSPNIITAYAGTGFAGYSGDEGDATSAMINGPRGIAIDSGGNVYFSDLSNGCVRKITASTGIITTYAGGFNLPNGLFVDSSGINNYLSHIKHIFLSLLC
jgi:hypothetical protein